MVILKGFGVTLFSNTALKVSQSNPMRLLVVTALGLTLAACASPTPDSKPKKQAATKEYFPESKYGVKASPRVAGAHGKAMPRGGGRNQTGKPYKIRGKWYHPKEDKKYAKTGQASWYGSAFHGRLTANGEVYDMNHLTAAHPTMPLPSYARVTHVENGSSVIVRVNDRGPYHGGRIIDLSQKAAEMLDYTDSGTAKVKVEYVGRAPLEGNDDEFLLASYQSGSDSIGQPASGVMLAMNGTTPETSAVPLPQQSILTVQNDQYQPILSDDTLTIPASNVPMPAVRPENSYNIALAGYASDRVARASGLEDTIYASVLSVNAMSDAWRNKYALSSLNISETNAEYIDLGYFPDLKTAKTLVAKLQNYGELQISQLPGESGSLYNVTAVAAQNKNDDMLRLAWEFGAKDAFIVR